MPLFTYICTAGHSHDALGQVRSPSCRPCPECGGQAERQQFYANTVIGETRTPLDEKRYDIKEFEEASAEVEYAHEKAQNEAGRELKTPSMWNESKRRAKDLERKGVKDSSDFRGSDYGTVKYRNRWIGTRLAGDAKD